MVIQGKGFPGKVPRAIPTGIPVFHRARILIRRGLNLNNRSPIVKPISFPLASLCLSGALFLTGCFQTEMPSVPEGEDSHQVGMAASVASVTDVKWFQWCYNCIMPSMEVSPNSALPRSGYFWSYTHPVQPPNAVIWFGAVNNGHRYYPPFLNLADMDASFSTLYILSTTGQIAYADGYSASFTWNYLPNPPKGARRIGVNYKGDIAIVTNEPRYQGYLVQVYSPLNGWEDVDAGVIDIDLDANGGLWAVGGDKQVYYRPSAPPSAPGLWLSRGYPGASGASKISAGSGRVAVITNTYAGKGNTLMIRSSGEWVTIPGQADHLNVDYGNRLWVTSNEAKGYYTDL
jgi:hypothetical protein